MANVEILPSPIKSEGDKKKYKVIRLANGLTACLISEESPTEDNEVDSNQPKTEQKMAGASLCVGVGAYSDPKDVQGMAHFLEHMVFMGSEKFPAENDFIAFLEKGGGVYNASTTTEKTTFYFGCLENNFYQALDKLAQFFIAPLMKKDAMTREREAIESEFQIRLPNDYVRKAQVLSSLTHPDSGVDCFVCGNLITLKENISDEKLYEGVHGFRKRHYSAHRMTLAIQGRFPIETLESYVLDCFSNVPNNGLPPDSFKQFATGAYDTSAFHKIYYIKPNTDMCQVELNWSLPPLRSKYKSKPGHYISYLLGDDGKGSLGTYLRKKVWALSTSVGIDDDLTYSLFVLSVSLTDEGLAHLYEVIEAVYAYINMVKKIGPEETRFQEMKTIAEAGFRFATEVSAADAAESFCQLMQLYPPEDYIAGSRLFYEYDPEAIIEVINLLRPRRMNVTIMSTDLPNDIKYDKVEKWLGTPYTYKDIPESWLQKWETVKPYDEFNIPPPNPYLTTNYDILPESANHPEYPHRLVNTPSCEVWYRKDQKFKLPNAYYNFYLITPMSINSAANTALTFVYINLLTLAVTEEVFPASIANLSYSFEVNQKGIVVKVYGYNEKLPLLANVLSKYVVTMSDRLTEEMFNAVKDKVLQSYYNGLLAPATLAKNATLNLLVNDYWPLSDKYSALQGVTYGKCKEFCKNFVKSLYVKALVQGNVSPEVATRTVNEFVKNLQSTPLPAKSYPEFRVSKLLKGEKCCRIQGFNKSDANSIITNYYQAGPYSVRDRATIETVLRIIKEPLFDVLRTKEQLGYAVSCVLNVTFGILGFSITVNSQATKFTTQYVDERIEKFLKQSQKILADTSEDALNKLKQDLIKGKQVADVDLQQEFERNWVEIVNDRYMFDRLQQEIKIIEKLTIHELRKWWDKHNLFGTQENFKKLSVQVVGYNIKENEGESNPSKSSSDTPQNEFKLKFLGRDERTQEKRDGDYFITDIEKFKDKLELYPTIHYVQNK